jgi:hypothetical protein
MRLLYILLLWVRSSYYPSYISSFKNFERCWRLMRENVLILTKICCSLEIISQISQPASSIFLSQKTSQQYFQPARSTQANRPMVPAPRAKHFSIDLGLAHHRCLRSVAPSRTGQCWSTVALITGDWSLRSKLALQTRPTLQTWINPSIAVLDGLN